ncbi:hypothetical protein CSA56_16870 [candidate division KSB3 bacterium]|uniref:Uncharacterized protein n=1 Tax=candidate division KSB3 bacterium TaxID=2044937 RepID=A0A2G6K8H9_9BACT|nr:MAG: hypothetical protein CSA56_16870 [candidate division KSB3 bacterium]
MPFSILLQGYPTRDIPVAHVQGPAIQGMFLNLAIAQTRHALRDQNYAAGRSLVFYIQRLLFGPR